MEANAAFASTPSGHWWMSRLRNLLCYKMTRLTSIYKANIRTEIGSGYSCLTAWQSWMTSDRFFMYQPCHQTP